MPPPNPLLLKHRPSASNLHDPPTPSSPHSHGFRAQINQLLPKHSYFRARVHIHQIHNIPLVSGEFAVRWKFKNARPAPGIRHGLLGIVRSRSKPGDHRHSKDLPDDGPTAGPPAPSVLVSPSERDSSSSSRIPSFSSSSSSSSGIPTLHVANYTTQSTQSEPVSLYSPSPFSSNSANASGTTLHLPAMSADTTPTPAFPSYPDALPASALLASNTPSRGSTPYLELKDHSVHWNQSLSTVIRFDVERDTGSLLPCPLKLVVMQRVKPDDSMGNPQNPRLGAVYLNLSEYVGRGPVDRRYLLRESRINATLKLTIELDYISGETKYIAPPLPKGEILNGLAGYLEEGLHRTRGQVAHGVDMYGPYRDQEELELDLFGVRRLTKRSWSTHPRDDYDSDGDGSDSDTEAPVFDVERLPIAYGTKTTETLIEAIFNPVRTNEKRCESPFTVFVPSAPPSRAKSGDRGVDLISRTNLDARSGFAKQEEVASVYSTESSSGSSGSGAMSRSTHSQHSQHSHSSSEPASVGGGRVKEWWRRMAS